MRRLLIILAILIIGISFSHLYTKMSLYSFIKPLEYNIVNNELYYKKENTKDNYSNYLIYFDKDIVNNKDELYSMYYTILNNGYNIYTFNCSYDCYNDINNIDSLKLSLINQLVSTKNAYKEIKTTYSTDRKVTLNITKKYKDEELTRIDEEIDKIIRDLKINNYTDVYNKIKVFHDYIANKNKYDSKMANDGESEYHSNTAIGPLFEGHAICDGYSDALAFFLDKIGIENIKITNDEHVWNAIKLNDKWYHIDLTWDDPVYTNGKDLTIHDYFIITTNELKNKDDGQHSFDENIYDFIK